MRNNKKGFTLAELLIVIAIIAILIAIAIPVFASQLRAARLATDHANIRSAYAWAQSANLMGQADIDGNGTITDGTGSPATTVERAPYGTGTPTVTFYRDGSISSTASGKQPYTLMVTAKPEECQESAPCNNQDSANGHIQNNKITIVYGPKTTGSTENEWKVVLTA